MPVWVLYVVGASFVLVGLMQLLDIGYRIGVRDTEARWHDAAARCDEMWRERAARWQEEIADLNNALAPYGNQLCETLPKDGNEDITLPYYEFMAVRASFKTIMRWTPGESNFGFIVLRWRAHRLLQGRRP